MASMSYEEVHMMQGWGSSLQSMCPGIGHVVQEMKSDQGAVMKYCHAGAELAAIAVQNMETYDVVFEESKVQNLPLASGFIVFFGSMAFIVGFTALRRRQVSPLEAYAPLIEA